MAVSNSSKRMNRNNIRIASAAAAVASALSSFAVSPASAATVTWNLAGSGNWDTVTGNWTGGSPTANLYNNATPDSAVFSNTAGGTITLAAGITPAGTTVSATSGTYTFAGASLGGSGGLTKSNGGTLILNTSPTYSGTTTLSGGVLSLATATVGIPTGNLSIGDGAGGGTGVFMFAGSSGSGTTGKEQTFARAVGTGTSQVQWTGSGGFASDGSANRVVNLGGAGATLTWGSGSFVPTGSSLIMQSAGYTSATNATTFGFANPIDFGAVDRTIKVNDLGLQQLDATFNGAFSGTGGLNKTGAGTLSLGAASTYTGGSTTITEGGLQLAAQANLAGGTLAGGSGPNLNIVDGFLVANTLTGATTGFTRALGTGAGQVQLTGNGGFSGFSSVGSITVNLGGNATPSTVTWDTGGFTQSGKSLLLGVGDFRSATIFMNPINLNGAQRTFNAGLNKTDYVTLPETYGQLSGVLSNGGIIKEGVAVLKLAAGNTYTGATTINAGTLAAGAVANAFGVNSAVTLANYGGIGGVGAAVMDISGSSQSIGSLAGGGASGGNVTLGTRFLTLGGNDTSTTYDGVISGSTGGITKTGIGTQIITRATSYTGLTTVSNGSLKYGVTDMLSTGGVTVNGAGATLDLDTFSDSVGAVTLTLGTIAGNGGTLTSTSGFTVVNGTISAKLAGSVGLTKNTSGVNVTLSGNNSYSGTTTINQGSLFIDTLTNSGNNSSIGTNGTINVGLTTAGGIVYNGAATSTDRVINLQGTTGGVLIDQSSTSGLLEFTSNFTATGVGAKTVTLQGSTLATGKISGAIPDAATSTVVSLTKSGTGTWTLSGANGYTGTTSVLDGKLAYGASNVINTGPVTVNGAAATLDIGTFSDSVGTVTLTNGTITGSTGVLTTTAANFSVDSGTISAILNGTNVGLTKANNTNVVTLTRANTFDGKITMPSGTIITNNLKNAGIASNLGTGTVDNTIDFGGARLTYNGTGDTTDRVININAATTAQIQADSTGTPLVLTGNITGTTVAGNRTLKIYGSGAAEAAGIISNGTGAILIDKQGTNTWTFSNANSYTGATSISDGTLAIANTGSLANTAIAVTATGTFKVSTTSGGTTFIGTGVAGATGATLNLASGTTFSMVDGNIGTTGLRQGNTFATYGATLTSANLNFELNSTSADKLAITKFVTPSGTNKINLTTLGSSLTPGNYDLITAASGLAIANYKFGVNNLTTQTVAVGGNSYLLTLSTPTTGNLRVNVGTGAALGALTWTGQTNGSGAASSSWDTLTNNNNFASGSTAINYADGNAVSFLDTNAVTASAVTNSTVTVQAAGVSPSSTTFNNSAVNYTVSNASGVVGIAGGGGLTKTGTGTATLASANTYTGTTTINQGTLALGTSGSIANSAIVVVGDAGSSGAVLDVSAKAAYTFGSGQTVKGIGTVNIGSGKTITNLGTLAPGNSIGTINVTGDYTFGATSTYTVETDATTSDKIAISGAATIASGAAISFTGTTGAGKYVLATAASGLGSPNFAGTAPTDYRLIYSATELDLQHKSTIALTTTTPANTSAHVGSSVGINVSVANTAVANSSDLNYTLTGAITGTGTRVAQAGPGSAITSSFSAVQGVSTLTTTATDANATNSPQSVSYNVTGYNLANAATSQTVNVGNTHFGVAKTGAVTLSNTAPVNATYTETLSSGAFSGTTSGFTTAGSASGIAGGGSGSGTLLVGLGTGLTAGAQSGTTTLALNSNEVNSSGLGTTAIPSQTITITGGVYNLAAATTSQTVNVGNVHAGVGGTAAVTLSNTAPVNATYTETLSSNGFTGTTSGFTATGAASGIAGGSSGSGTLLVGLGAGLTAGAQSGTTTLALNSNEVNSSGLGTTAIPSQTITITGNVFNLASASAHTPEPVAFGNVLVGSTQAQLLSLTNNAPTGSFTEKLDASVNGSATGDATATGNFAALLAAGSTNNTDLSVGVNTATAGAKSGTATITLTSDGTGTSGLGTTSLASQTVNVSATVYDAANASFDAGSDQNSLSVNIGTFTQGSGSHTAGFDIYNLLADPTFTANLSLLSFNLNTPDASALSTDLGVFDNVAGGSSYGGFLASLSTSSLGTFSESYDILLNSTGFGDTPQTLTLTISGNVVGVPEPTSVAVLALGGLGVFAGRRRRKI